jgi:Flp pilus assembly protein TadD
MNLHDESVAALRESVRIKPGSAETHNYLGFALKQKGLLDEAIAEYREALRLDPQRAVAYTDLGIAFNAKGLLDDAVAAFRESVRISPPGSRWQADNRFGLNDLAWHFSTAADLQDRRPVLAVELAREAVALGPDWAQWNTLGAAHYRAGDWQAAIEALEKSMSLSNGGNSFDRFFLAMAHWQAGRAEEARKWQKEAIEWMDRNQPDNEELRRFRAEAEELIK